MALSKDAREWLEAQNNEFMHAYSAEFTEQEALAELADPDLCEPRDAEDCGAGWYARLSAPGYLDCTDWIGPFDSEDEAFEALYETYGD